MDFFQNIWNFNFDWILSGNTWTKKRRFVEYENEKSLPININTPINNNINSIKNDISIENIEDVYWKYQICISGITYQYVISNYEITTTTTTVPTTTTTTTLFQAR